MQYQSYTEGVYVTYTDGVDTFRDGVRSSAYVIDKTLTFTGFSGTEDVDWTNLTSVAYASASDIFRDGVRDGTYVIDKTLTVTGFAGTESLDEGITGDWINLETQA